MKSILEQILNQISKNMTKKYCYYGLWLQLFLLLNTAGIFALLERLFDIPDINCYYKGARCIEELTGDVSLVNGARVRLHSRDQLERSMRWKRGLLDLIADNHGLNRVFPYDSSEESPYFAGDIIMTERQMRAISEDYERRWYSNIGTVGYGRRKKKKKKKRKRQIDTDFNDKWHNGVIRYTFDTDIDADLKGKILEAIRMWSRDSCLQFVPVAEANDMGDYLVFTRIGRCASFLGKIGGPQAIHVGPGCEMPGIIAHLIGHALGLWHEHQRPDRDQYLMVNLSNAMPNHLDAFIECTNCVTHSNQHFGTVSDYDFGSIMQSNAWAYSTYGEKTLLPHNGDYLMTMGAKNTGPTFDDIKRINAEYCSDECEKRSRQPDYNGYWHPRYPNCSVELCPDGFSGTLCTSMEQGRPTFCGMLIMVSETEWSRFETPNYPDNFNPGQQCSFYLSAPRDKRIELRFIDDFDFVNTEPCDVGFVEVRTGKMQTTGFRFCGPKRPVSSFVSDQNEMLVLLRHKHDSLQTNSGFRAEYRYIDKPLAAGNGNNARPFSENSAICRDKLPSNICRKHYVQSSTNSRCNSVPNARDKCRKSCGFCRKSTVKNRNSCSDELSKRDCEQQYLDRHNCDSPRARRRCSYTCDHC